MSVPVITARESKKKTSAHLYILGGIFFASALVAGSLAHITFKNFIHIKVPSFKAKTITTAENSILTHEYVDPFALITADRQLESRYQLVDLRDAESYRKEHIKKSVNIPYTKGALDETLLQKDKRIILYSYTDYSVENDMVKMYLRTKGYSVSILKTGWNTFRHFSNLWIPEYKWGSIRVDDYVESDNTQ